MKPQSFPDKLGNIRLGFQTLPWSVHLWHKECGFCRCVFIHPCVRFCSPLCEILFTPVWDFIHPCVRFCSPLCEILFTPVWDFILPCEILFTPVWNSPLCEILFTPVWDFIHPCLRFYSPLSEILFTPVWDGSGDKADGNGDGSTADAC